MRSTHSSKLERWLGASQVEHYSEMFKNWYGPPVPLAGVPGSVFVTGGGDFVGPIRGGGLSNLWDFAVSRQQRVFRNFLKRQKSTANMGFSSLSDLISEATTGGKSQLIHFHKVGTTVTTVGNASSLWAVGTLPPAGSTGGTSGTGRECTNATTGALPIVNAAGADTLHLTTITALAGVVSSMMLVDRLWDMTYSHTTTGTAVDASNRPTRYQSTDASGTFISGEVTTAVTSTNHTMTLTYVDQDGNTAEAAAGVVIIGRASGLPPLPTASWFIPLNSGDTGVRYLTNIGQSVGIANGVSNWWLGKPLCLIPSMFAAFSTHIDGINSAFNLTRVLDDACLFFYLPRASNGSQTLSGTLRLISG